MRAPFILLGFLGFLATGCAGHALTATSPNVPGATPAWVTPYTPEQEALLAPGNAHINVPARRVFPDLERFAYSDDVILGDPREAVRVTQLVAEAVEHSPRYYDLAKAGPELANPTVQYGPRGEEEPDAWKIAFIDGSGQSHIVVQTVSDDAREAFDDGLDAEKKAHFDEAEQRFRAATEESPDAVAPHLALARMLGRHSVDLAEAELRKTLRLDPTLATTHRELAQILLDRGDIAGARREIAHALAYYPTSRTALALAGKLPAADTDADPRARQRVRPFSIFLDVDGMGAIRMGTVPVASARMYAGCRAVLRFEPEVRAELFSIPRDEPYFLSAEEEMICVEAGIGAMIVDRQAAIADGRHPEPDEQADALLRMAHTEGLLGYVMFEILGQSRPELARMAPASVHRAIVAYVNRHVLGWDPSNGPSGLLALSLDRANP